MRSGISRGPEKMMCPCKFREEDRMMEDSSRENKPIFKFNGWIPTYDRYCYIVIYDEDRRF